MLNAEQILFGFIDAKRELKIIEQKYDMMQREFLPKSPGISDMPKSHSQEDRMAEMVAKLEEIEEQCLKVRQIMIDRFTFVDHLISKVESPLLKDILTERYILGKTWQLISESTTYSMPQVFRLRKQALQEIQKLLDDCK